MITPKDTDRFLVDINHGYHYHRAGCLVTVKPMGPIPPDVGYRELSYGEIKAIRTYDGHVFEPDVCVLPASDFRDRIQKMEMDKEY